MSGLFCTLKSSHWIEDVIVYVRFFCNIVKQFGDVIIVMV